ncbi:MAG: hypothetical protein NTW82_08975 [Bacteroidia bacterium]|nr:hypothetical protein [Bacteroidia bacterium]
MVLRNSIKIIRKTFLFVAMVLFFSCEDPGLIVINCSECLTDEPVNANLTIKLEHVDYDVNINIYQGNLEDSILYESFATTANVAYRKVPLNKKYTLTATYYISGNSYVVVNSVAPRALYDEDDCEEPCYFVYNSDIDMRLKYTKYGGN